MDAAGGGSGDGVRLQPCAVKSTLSFILATILPLGALLSYLPQFGKIIRRNSSLGVNFPCLCGLALTNVCSLCSYCVLRYRATFTCCTHGTMACANAYLPVSQLATTFCCASGLVFCFCRYYAFKDDQRAWNVLRLQALAVFVLAGAIMGCAFLVHPWSSAAPEGSGGSNNSSSTGSSTVTGAVKVYGDATSIAAAILTSVHWLPQIYETCGRFRTARTADELLGSLSLLLLVLQAAGCLLTFVNVRDVVVGVPYLIASLMMSVLLGMTLQVWCRERSKDMSKGEDACLLEDPAADQEAVPPS